MSDTHTIKIKQGNADGTLDLSDGGHTIARNKDFISWNIKQGTEVTSIERIEKKSGIDIFKTPPYFNGDDWIAEIKDDLPKDCEWEYAIIWNGKFGRQVHDPKISVNPS
jgi:hypothetical protein